MRPWKTILLATDFSPHAERAVELAIEFAQRFGARVEVLHAFALPIRFVSPYEVAIPDEYLERCREQAAEQLGEVAARVRAAGLDASARLAEVPAASAIEETAREIGADLIVMGTRGRTGLKHIVSGSVAERTVQLAPCPVLTVKDGRA